MKVMAKPGKYLNQMMFSVKCLYEMEFVQGLLKTRLL